MSTVKRSGVVAPMAMLILSQPALGQNSFDIREVDARNAAHEIMTAAEEQFDCEFEEHSMRDVGDESGLRYLFHVKAEGSECREALVFVTNMATREGKLIFRQVADSTQNPTGPLIYYGQVLIHEINPEIDGKKDPEK